MWDWEEVEEREELEERAGRTHKDTDTDTNGKQACTATRQQVRRLCVLTTSKVAVLPRSLSSSSNRKSKDRMHPAAQSNSLRSVTVTPHALSSCRKPFLNGDVVGATTVAAPFPLGLTVKSPVCVCVCVCV